MLPVHCLQNHTGMTHPFAPKQQLKTKTVFKIRERPIPVYIYERKNVANCSFSLYEYACKGR